MFKIKNLKILLLSVILLLVNPFNFQAQTEEENLLRETFNEYKQAILQGKFDVLWDLLIPEIQKELEKAYEKMKIDPEYREAFVLQNWWGVSDEEVNVLRYGSGKEVFIALAKLAQEGKADAYGDEFEEEFKTGEIKKIEINEVKWKPALEGFIKEMFPSYLISYLKEKGKVLVGLILYELPDGTELSYNLYKIDGKWKFPEHPVSIMTDEKELIVK